MPHPGDIVRKGEFKGETSKLHPDFIKNLKDLVPSLLNTPLVKTDASGNELTSAALVDYFKVFFLFLAWRDVVNFTHGLLSANFYKGSSI